MLSGWVGKKKQRRKESNNAIYSTDEIYCSETHTPNPYRGFNVGIYFYICIFFLWHNFLDPERI